MKTTVIKYLVAACTLLTSISSFAQKEQIPEAALNLKQFYGTWDGNLTVMEEGKTLSIGMHWDCTKTAEGLGAYFNTTRDEPGSGKTQLANLAGYDPGDSLIYWFAVDNQSATVYKGNWVNPQHLLVEYSTFRHGGKLVETIDLIFKSKEELEVKMLSTLADKELGKVEGIFRLKKDKPKK